MALLKRLCFPAVLLFAAVSSTWAQTSAAPVPHPTRVQAGVGLLMGPPVGDFSHAVNDAGGVSGQLDVGLGSFVSVGGEAAYLSYGTESRKIDLGAAIPELPGATATLNTDNAMVLAHGRVRVQSPRGRWRPYVDGLCGFNYIYTRTSIEESGSCNGSSCSSSIAATNLDDFVLSFGGGAGVLVDVGRPGGLRLDLSVRYLRGGEADYLTEGGIRRVAGQAILDIKRSRTDMAVFYVGISYGR